MAATAEAELLTDPLGDSWRPASGPRDIRHAWLHKGPSASVPRDSADRDGDGRDPGRPSPTCRRRATRRVVRRASRRRGRRPDEVALRRRRWPRARAPNLMAPGPSSLQRAQPGRVASWNYLCFGRFPSGGRTSASARVAAAFRASTAGVTAGRILRLARRPPDPAPRWTFPPPRLRWFSEGFGSSSVLSPAALILGLEGMGST